MSPLLALSVAVAAAQQAAPPARPSTERLVVLAQSHDPCDPLPLSLRDADHDTLDLDGDAWADRLLQLPGSCARVTCTWRVYRHCPGGGYRTLAELMALRMVALEPPAGSAWRDLVAWVPAPSNEPQAWRLRFDGARYVRHEPLTPAEARALAGAER